MERSDGLKELLENSPSTRNSTSFFTRSYVLRRDEKGSIIFLPQFASLKQFPRWEDLDKDLLALIFNKLDVIDLTMGVSRVCISWFLASHNKTLWNTVDISKLQLEDNPYKPVVFYSYPVGKKGLSLSLLLCKIFLFFVGLMIEVENGDISLEDLLSLLEGNMSLKILSTKITKLSGTVPKNLIFNFSSSIQEKDLLFIAQKMPNIEKLVLPIWCYETKDSFWCAFRRWKNLKTLIVASNLSLTGEFEFQTVGANCNNLKNLKYLGNLTINIANQIVRYLKNLKRLSLRCSRVSSTGVLSLITGLPNLAILNLSHCQDLDGYGKPVPISNLVQAATQKLGKFIICSQYDCRICKDQHGFSFNYYSKDWQNDEIKEFEF